jgi:hypothetical protein
MKPHLVLPLLLVLATPLAAQTVITSYSTFQVAAGNEVFLPANSPTPGVAGLDLTRGAGLSPNAGSNSFNSAGWDWPGGVRQANDHVSSGFTVEPGYAVDGLRLLFGSRSSNTGPGPMAVFWSGDAFAAPIHSFTQPGGGTNDWYNGNVDLSSLGTLAAGNYEFRFQSTSNNRADANNTSSAIASAGTWRVGDYFDGSFSLFQFQGNVIAIPEPSRAILFALGGLLLIARRKR